MSWHLDIPIYFQTRHWNKCDSFVEKFIDTQDIKLQNNGAFLPSLFLWNWNNWCKKNSFLRFSKIISNIIGDRNLEGSNNHLAIIDINTNFFFVNLCYSLTIEPVRPIIGITVLHLFPYQLGLWCHLYG